MDSKRHETGEPFHTGAWLAWLTAGMLAALGTRNPFYMVSTILCAYVVARFMERLARGQYGGQSVFSTNLGNTESRGRGLLLRAVVVLTLAVMLLKSLSLHLGTTVLFSLPDGWPVIGGPITAESIASSGLDALQILAVLAVFAAFSAGADYYSLLRMLPSFLHQVGLIISIAITFVPQTVTRFAEIREASALRGHRVRGAGDLLPLVMPLLSGGMERSINLAEAMESRGFSRPQVVKRRIAPLLIQIGISLSIGLILVGSAISTFASKMVLLGWFTMGAGSVVLLLTLWKAGRGVNKTRFRKQGWYSQDSGLVSLSLGVAVFLVTYRLLAPQAFSYYPFPTLYMPPLDPTVGGSLLLLLSPVLLRLSEWKG